MIKTNSFNTSSVDPVIKEVVIINPDIVMVDEIKDVSDKVYTRDLFGSD